MKSRFAPAVSAGHNCQDCSMPSAPPANHQNHHQITGTQQHRAFAAESVVMVRREDSVSALRPCRRHTSPWYPDYASQAPCRNGVVMLAMCPLGRTVEPQSLCLVCRPGDG
jgi:hypothetical protein